MKQKLLAILATLLCSLTAVAQEAKVYTVFNQSTQTLIYRYDNSYNLSHPYQEEYDPINTPDALRFALYYNLVKRVTIDASMAEAPLTSMKNLFYGGYDSESGVTYSLYNMTAIEGLENLNTSKVTDMHAMFYGCQALKEIDVSEFNTANVTDMSYMFYDCLELTALSLYSFNTEKVTDMSHMFAQSGLKTLDLTSFDTDKVTDMSGMFYGCVLLTTIYCSDYWSTSTAVSDNMFFHCIALVGGEGTAYNSSVVDKTYARPDGGTSQPGYFTKVNVYTKFVEEEGTLTYYFDRQMKWRAGVSEVYDPVGNPDAVRFTGYNDKVLKVVIDSSMKNARLTSMNGMFYGGFNMETFKIQGLTKLTVIEGLENLNTAYVTNMMSMFAECQSLTTLYLTSFNTAKVTDMSYMFSGCKALTTIYCGSDWSASAALTSSDNMFLNCNALKGGKGTAWSSSYKDKTYARPDLGTSQPGYFTKDWVYTEFVEATGTVTYYYDDQMASRTGVTVVYDPVNNPGANRFEGYYAKMTKAVIDPSMKNAPLTSMYRMFGMPMVTTIEGMENLNTSNVTDMSQMFAYCYALTSLDLSTFNTAKVVDMSEMFRECGECALTSLDLTSFNTAEVVNMRSMFDGCGSLASLDLTSFNTAKVEDMSCMFRMCFALRALDLTSFNTANVTDMSSMFESSGLRSLDLRSFNTAKVVDMHRMFLGSAILKTIWCDDDWSTSTVLKDSENMFTECNGLVGGKGTSYNEASVRDVSYARPDGGTEAPGYFTKYEKKVYTEYDEATQTLTYRYDALISLREGVTEVYDPVGNPDAVRFTDYYDKVVKAAIDPSMKEAPLTSMNGMFYGGFVFNPSMGNVEIHGLTNMTAIEGLENLNTTQVTNMSSMFAECQSLTTLDLNSFNTDKVTDMGWMFSNCYALTTINCGNNWSASGILTSSDNMFFNCKALVGGKGTTFDSTVVDATYARPDGGEEAPGYFTDYIAGDINGDGTVDVSDYIGIANFILGNPPSGFNEAAADVNNDGNIDVSDYIGVANIILTGSVYGK